MEFESSENYAAENWRNTVFTNNCRN